MNLKNLRIAKSATSDKIYLGKVDNNGKRWVGDKKDVTSDFYKCIIDVFAGYETDIVGEDGRKYRITVEEMED